MGFIKLNRFNDPSGATFDAVAVVEQVSQSFPEARILSGDPLSIAAERAATLGAADHVIQTLRQNEQAYGPAREFEINSGDGTTIRGRARRYDVTLLFDEPLADKWRQRLLKFLNSLGPGRIETASEGVGQPA